MKYGRLGLGVECGFEFVGISVVDRVGWMNSLETGKWEWKLEIGNWK